MFRVIADLKAAGSRYNKKKRPELKREQHLKKRPAWKERKAVLNNRLKELLVFELTLEGHREFKPMTLRSLYTYVLNSITTRPPGSFVSTRQLTMQPVAQANSSSSDSSRHRRGTVDNDIDIDDGEQRDNLDSSSDEGNDPPYNTRGDELTDPGSEAFKNGSDDSDLLDNTMNSSVRYQKRVTFDEDANENDDNVLDDTLQRVVNKPRKSRSKRNDVPIPTKHLTHRERLGGYLHPRDMRRLVTPFSSTNEPEIIVRRHVILLNMDPLRAIVLRDRLLVLVPDGADAILEQLEKRVRGGLKEMENFVFDDETERNSGDISHSPSVSVHTEHKHTVPHTLPPNKESLAIKEKQIRDSLQIMTGHVKNSSMDTTSESDDDGNDDEWLDMNKRDWIDVAFEFQSVDAVLHVVCAMLFEEANALQELALDSVDSLLKNGSSADGELSHDILRRLKNEMSEMSSRVLGFIRALNLVLDDDEDLALMNLSRLISHPERFILPVPEKVLHEESDEPELILEAYLQQALSTTNALDLVKNEMNTTEELMNMKLDAVRNRLLYINTITAFTSLTVTIGSFIGSIFGMNLTNPLQGGPDEELERAWNQVVLWTCVGGLILFILMMVAFAKAAQLQSIY